MHRFPAFKVLDVRVVNQKGKDARPDGCAEIIVTSDSGLHLHLAGRREKLEEEIIDYCRKNLASYKKPRFIKFVNSLPRNNSDKNVKNSLRKE